MLFNSSCKKFNVGLAEKPQHFPHELLYFLEKILYLSKMEICYAIQMRIRYYYYGNQTY